MAVDIVIGFDSLVLVFAIGLWMTRSLLVPAAGFQLSELAGIRRAGIRLNWLSLTALWVTGLAWLWVRTAAMSGRPLGAALPVVPTVLFRSRCGTVWWLLAVAVLVFRGRHARGFGAAVLLFGLAWAVASRSASGHATADGYWTLRVGMDWLHWAGTPALYSTRDPAGQAARCEIGPVASGCPGGLPTRSDERPCQVAAVLYSSNGRGRLAPCFAYMQPLHYTTDMPTIYREGHWKIVMHFDDHGMPHFPILTPDAEAKAAIDTLGVIAGNMDRKTLAAARAWATEIRALPRRRWHELSEIE